MAVTNIRGQQILNGTVQYIDIQNVTANTILGNNTASATTIQEIALATSTLLGRAATGNISAITLGTGLSFSGTSIVLSSNTISGVALGSNLFSLTAGTGLSGTAYNGSAAQTWTLATAYGDSINPYDSKTANYVLAAPNGTAGVPTFRALVAADIPALSYQAPLNGTGYVKMSGTTVSYVASIPNTDLANSSITVQGASVSLGGSVNVINGTGFVKATGTTISYDNSTYYLASNPSGYTTNTGTVTSVGGTGTVSGLTLSGTVTTSGNLTLGGTLSASIDNITDEHRLFNNMGDDHGTRSQFDATNPSYNFGWRYVQGSTNGPGVNSATQYYSVYVGLGNNYLATGAGSYGMMLAIPRNVTTPYLTIRYNENNSFAAWQKISAGYADSAGNATTVTSITSGQVTTALGYTPYNSTNPNGYTSNTGTVTSVSGTGTVSGLTLSGTVTTSGSLTLGGTLTLTAANVNAVGAITNSTSGSAGSVANAVTFTTTGGAAAGTTYNGSVARTIDYSTVGAAPASHTHTLLSSAGDYVWTESTAANSYSTGLSLSFVQATNGWFSYGTVINAKGYSSGGGSALQIYVPYSPTYGGNSLKVRFGNYDTTAWTAWKTLWADDNDGSGSGLDADLLDGNHASAFYLATNPNGYTSNTGTVTSVALSLPGIFSVSGSPVTTSGTLSATLASQTANTVFAAPNGAAGAPTFRALVAADIPALSYLTGNQTITLTGDVTGSGTTSIATTVNAYFDQRVYTRSDNYLGGYYVSGGTEKPNNTIFGAGKFKVAMLAGSNLGFSGSWNDVLWISTYNGSDVKSSHALVFDKYSSDVWVADQNYDSATWGTGYKLWHSGNLTDNNQLSNGSNYITAAQTYYIGTTQNALNRSSAAQTLTGISIDGSAAQWGGYSLPTRTNWNSRSAQDIVVGQLSWRHYGDNHTIIDVSSATTPSGAATSRTDADNAWSAQYPTLVGWNGTNTYGVRVDRARLADSVPASGITGQTGMWTSATRPGPYRLYRRDDDSNYSVQTSYSADRSGYWSLRGYSGDSYHAPCYVAYSGYADSAGSATNALRIVYADGPRDLSDRLPNSFTRTVNFDFVSSGTVGGTGNYAGVMTYSPWDGTTGSTGDSSYQLAFMNGTSLNGAGLPSMRLRKGIDTTWGSWYTLLNSGNATYAWNMNQDVRTSDTVRFNQARFSSRISIGDGNGTPYLNTGSPGVWLSYNGGSDLFMGAESATSWGVYISAWRMTVNSSGTLTVGGDVIAYGTPSDARLKTIKEVIQNPIEKIKALSGYKFDWKQNNGILNLKEDIGVIAQEVAAVLPELARTNDNGYMSVRYQGLTAVLIEAVKEQQSQIESLKKQIEYLVENSK